MGLYEIRSLLEPGMINQYFMSAMLLAVACGHGEPSSTRRDAGVSSGIGLQPEVQERQAKAAALATAADRALADSVRLDYRRPETDGGLQRDNVRQLFWDACQAGDHRSCWLSSEVRDQGAAKEQVAPAPDSILRQACQSGDVMSCRAIHDGAFIMRHRVGAGSAERASPCPAGDVCPMEDARKECALGFPESCRSAINGSPRPPDAAELASKAARLEREGCKAGLIDECAGLFFATSSVVANGGLGMDGDVDLVQARADYVLAGETLCTLTLRNCEKLSQAYGETDLTKARDAMERTCQFHALAKTRVDACAGLAVRYESEANGVISWPEPVPGRRKALQAWLDNHPKAKD